VIAKVGEKNRTFASAKVGGKRSHPGSSYGYMNDPTGKGYGIVFAGIIVGANKGWQWVNEKAGVQRSLSWMRGQMNTPQAQNGAQIAQQAMKQRRERYGLRGAARWHGCRGDARHQEDARVS